MAGPPTLISRLLHRLALRPVLLRLWTGLLLCALVCTAGAATYTYRSDSYAWETTTNTISWDHSCTGYPDDDDKATITFTGGFTFTFAGTAYSSVRVLSNGMLQFGADTGLFRDFSPDAMPLGTAPSRSGCTAGAAARVLVVHWIDLAPSFGGTVTWQQKGSAPNRYVVVSWNAVRHYNTGTPYTFQVILYENGEFKYQYGTNATGSGATIGVQVSGSDYTQYSYDTVSASSTTAIRWTTASRLAEYRMDETSWNGTAGEVADSSGNGYDGRSLGSAQTNADGYVCRAMDIPSNGTSSISAVDTTLDVDSGIGSGGSVSFWYRSDTAWSSSSNLALFDATTVATAPFYLMRMGGGAVRFVVADSAGTTLTATSAAQSYSAHVWVHIAVSWRLAVGSGRSSLVVYINGTQVASTSGTTNGQLPSSLGTLYLGDNRSAVTPSGGTLNSANGRLDEVRIYNYPVDTTVLASDIAATHTCSGASLHHLEIRHASGTGLTCTPSTVTVAACQDAACTSVYTGGVTGSLTSSGASVSWPDGSAFSIAAGGSTVDVRLQVTAAGSALIGTGTLTPSAASATTCNFGSPSCTFTAADSGLLFDVPNHAAETSQSFTVSAVKKADNSLACVPAFASVSKSINFKCNYSNPTTGSAPVRVGGSSVACAANGASSTGAGVSLAFDATGKATTSLLYADAGQIALTATYTGSGSDAGLSMTGTDSFIAAPASLAFSGVTSGNIKAGSAFSATVTALNSAGAATSNFGKETSPATVSLAFARRTPTGTNANGVVVSDGSFSGTLGSFSSGAATATNLSWTEVGTGDLTASLSNYLGSGLSASGSTGSGGAVHVIPYHFKVVVTSQGCGSFTYAGGQTFSTTVTAQNAANANTVNYDGSFGSPVSKAVTLADASALGGTISTGPHIAASVFRLGIGTGTASYGFASKQTAEKTLLLSASDTDGATSVGTAQTGNSTTLRSGRLRVANGFGSEKSALQLAVLAEYWSGNAWVLNSADSCTVVPAASVALSNYRDKTGAAVTAATQWTTTASAITLASGQGTLTLSAPSSGRTGTVDLALNLGSTAADQSCLATHPASTAGNLAWLRSRFGNCAATFDRDPSAQATFGVYSPETKKTVHVREIF